MERRRRHSRFHWSAGRSKEMRTCWVGDERCILKRTSADVVSNRRTLCRSDASWGEGDAPVVLALSKIIQTDLSVPNLVNGDHG